ncbi:MAG: tautomerase family protein [Trueperaceae bacterium]|nr:tautomerase family protein [Trueperaceae bacterium]
MAQIKIYGHRETLNPKRADLSNAIHSAVVKALSYPEDKRFHRFIALDEGDFIHPVERSNNYLILEILMFEGRSKEAKKQLIRLLYQNLGDLGIAADDLELVMIETPRENWGIRGLPGDELSLNYKVGI